VAYYSPLVRIKSTPKRCQLLQTHPIRSAHPFSHDRLLHSQKTPHLKNTYIHTYIIVICRDVKLCTELCVIMCVYISQLQPSAQGAQQALARQRMEPQVAFHALLGRFPPPLHPAAARCAQRASIQLLIRLLRGRVRAQSAQQALIFGGECVHRVRSRHSLGSDWSGLKLHFIQFSLFYSRSCWDCSRDRVSGRDCGMLLSFGMQKTHHGTFT
jgi:hypothetical protein